MEIDKDSDPFQRVKEGVDMNLTDMSEHKHNGKLPAGSELSTDGEVRWSGSFISISSGHRMILLDRNQASELLAWLVQQDEIFAGGLKGKSKETL